MIPAILLAIQSRVLSCFRMGIMFRPCWMTILHDGDSSSAELGAYVVGQAEHA